MFRTLNECFIIIIIIIIIVVVVVVVVVLYSFIKCNIKSRNEQVSEQRRARFGKSHGRI